MEIDDAVSNDVPFPSGNTIKDEIGIIEEEEVKESIRQRENNDVVDGAALTISEI